jgi:rhodanese-related sulfurtransferase
MRIPKILLAVILISFAGCVGQGKKEKMTGTIVINVLDKEFHDDCHIKGSIHVPYEEIVSFALGNIDKENSLIVTYCSNRMCTASGASAAELRAEGFKAMAYEDGVAGWYQKGLPVEGPCTKSYLLKKDVHPELEETKDISIISTEDLAHKLNFAS